MLIDDIVRGWAEMPTRVRVGFVLFLVGGLATIFGWLLIKLR